MIRRNSGIEIGNYTDLSGILVATDPVTRKVCVGITNEIAKNLAQELEVYGGCEINDAVYDYLKGQRKNRIAQDKGFNNLNLAYRFAGKSNHILMAYYIGLNLSGEPVATVVLNKGHVTLKGMEHESVCEADLEEVWNEVTEEERLEEYFLKITHEEDL